MGFELLGLSEGTLSAVADAGYTDPTPIQAQAIPQTLMGRDILGIAQTGTGKTASFTLPLIDILAEGRARARMPRCLILEPTRELAAQVADSFEKYGKNHKLSMALLIGGVNFSDQEKLLDKGVDVLIATPGRLLDHFERGKLLLTGIDILVVDEADRMLDMGFIPDVEKICSKITKKHQSLFFSATMPPPVEKLTQQFLSDPKHIEVAAPSTTANTIKQSLIYVGYREKRKALRHFLNTEEINNGIIFCNRKRDVKEVYRSLKRHKYSVGQLHGDMDQSERLAVLDGFKSGDIKLLVASDVAARGLDVADVSHVFNFDVPSHAEDYVHRIGRTGRAGRDGRAIMFATKGKDDTKYLEAIKETTGHDIEIEETPDLRKRRKPAKSDTAMDADQQSTAPEGAGYSENSDAGADSGYDADFAGDETNDHYGQRGRHSSNRRYDRNRGRGRYDNRRGGRYGRRSSHSRYEESDYERKMSEKRNPPILAKDDWPRGPVIGMGPHVPAFMLSPVQLKQSS